MPIEMREEVVYKYAIDDVRKMSFAEVCGLIFIDLADNIKWEEIVENYNSTEYKSLWMNRFIFMIRNGYKHYCMPDKKSIVLDDDYISITISPCGYEGIEIKYRHKDTNTIHNSYWDIDDCFNVLDAGAADSKNTTD